VQLVMICVPLISIKTKNERTLLLARFYKMTVGGLRRASLERIDCMPKDRTLRDRIAHLVSQKLHTWGKKGRYAFTRNR